jgi:hypothetical protein
MASFLKVGKRIINLDTVTTIDLHAELYGTVHEGTDRQRTGYVVPGVQLWFVDEGNQSFRGEDADALRAWVESVAIDAAAVVADRRAAYPGAELSFGD